jgi:hypothetical protein
MGCLVNALARALCRCGRRAAWPSIPDAGPLCDRCVDELWLELRRDARARGTGDGVPTTRAEVLREYLRQGKACLACQQHLCLAHDYLVAVPGWPFIFCRECAADLADD